MSEFLAELWRYWKARFLRLLVIYFVVMFVAAVILTIKELLK